jgi:hypothetical protein
MTEYEYMEELEGYMRKTYSDEISIQRGSGAINDYIGGYIGGIPTVMYHISHINPLKMPYFVWQEY